MSESQTLRGRLYLTSTMMLMVGLCLGLLLLRSRATGEFRFGFLVWNLILAVIPFPFALLSDALIRTKAWFAAAPSVVLWLLFLPNSPYLVTDLIHLEPQNVPYWYDTLLYGSFAITGVLLGFASVVLIHTAIRDRFGMVRGWVVALFSLTLSAYGIYLGRVERWNSWNAIGSPRILAERVIAPLHSPLQNARTIAFVGLYAAFLCIGYLAVAAIGAAFTTVARSTNSRNSMSSTGDGSLDASQGARNSDEAGRYQPLILSTDHEAD